MELMTEKERKEFLELSGYRKARNKMLNSLSMKEYLELLEGKFAQDSGTNPAKEIELVDKYTRLIEENKTTVSKPPTDSTILCSSLSPKQCH